MNLTPTHGPAADHLLTKIQRSPITRLYIDEQTGEVDDCGALGPEHHHKTGAVKLAREAGWARNYRNGRGYVHRCADCRRSGPVRKPTETDAILQQIAERSPWRLAPHYGVGAHICFDQQCPAMSYQLGDEPKALLRQTSHSDDCLWVRARIATGHDKPTDNQTTKETQPS